MEQNYISHIVTLKWTGWCVYFNFFPLSVNNGQSYAEHNFSFFISIYFSPFSITASPFLYFFFLIWVILVVVSREYSNTCQRIIYLTIQLKCVGVVRDVSKRWRELHLCIFMYFSSLWPHLLVLYYCLYWLSAYSVVCRLVEFRSRVSPSSLVLTFMYVELRGIRLLSFFISFLKKEINSSILFRTLISCRTWS